MKKKFKDIWARQSDFREDYGISAIAVGKLLIKAGLKDADTLQPTEKALEEGHATPTPLKDGTPFFMWRKTTVIAIIEEEYEPLDRKEKHVNSLFAAEKCAKKIEATTPYDGYKWAYIPVEDDIPEKIREEVVRIFHNRRDNRIGPIKKGKVKA